MKIIGLNGSLRTRSLNRNLLQAAGDCFSESVDFQALSLGDIPLYNQDLDGDNPPAAVAALKRAVSEADGLLLATPEYNFGMSGVLKNAIDWLSRPAFNSPLTGKATTIITASMSPLGGVRAQEDCRRVLHGTHSPVMGGFEYLLGSAHQAFDDSGRLTDEDAKRRLQRHIEQFEHWVGQQP